MRIPRAAAAPKTRRILPTAWRAAAALCASVMALSACDRGPGPTRAERIAGAYGDYARRHPAVPTVTLTGLDAARAAGPVILVDVREPREQAVSVIPGSVTLGEFDRRDRATSATVIAYCTVGWRSGDVVTRLRREGVNAVNLEGSILAWVNDGRPVVAPDGTTTTRVHVYGPEWNWVPPGYEAVW